MVRNAESMQHDSCLNPLQVACCLDPWYHGGRGLIHFYFFCCTALINKLTLHSENRTFPDWMERERSIVVQHACWACFATGTHNHRRHSNQSTTQKFPFRRNSPSEHSSSAPHRTPAHTSHLCFTLSISFVPSSFRFRLRIFPLSQPDTIVISSYLSLGICFSLIHHFYHFLSSFRGQKSR